MRPPGAKSSKSPSLLNIKQPITRMYEQQTHISLNSNWRPHLAVNEKLVGLHEYRYPEKWYPRSSGHTGLPAAAAALGLIISASQKQRVIIKLYICVIIITRSLQPSYQLITFSLSLSLSLSLSASPRPTGINLSSRPFPPHTSENTEMATSIFLKINTAYIQRYGKSPVL